MELYKGRPDTNEGRLEREIRVYDFLDDHGIEYLQFLQHDQFLLSSD